VCRSYGWYLFVCWCVLVLLSFVNCCSVSWTNRVQYIFTIAKVSALVIIIVIGIIQLSKGSYSN